MTAPTAIADTVRTAAIVQRPRPTMRLTVMNATRPAMIALNADLCSDAAAPVIATTKRGEPCKINRAENKIEIATATNIAPTASSSWRPRFLTSRSMPAIIGRRITPKPATRLTIATMKPGNRLPAPVMSDSIPALVAVRKYASATRNAPARTATTTRSRSVGRRTLRGNTPS